MSDIAQGPGWWLASDGKWYPPRDESQAPAPGWWLASDGKWYPPMESEEPPEADWWLASDGKWYPPDRKPGTRSGPAAAPATTWASTPDSAWAPPDVGRDQPVKPVPAAGQRPPGPPRPPVKPIPAPPGRLIAPVPTQGPGPGPRPEQQSRPSLPANPRPQGPPMAPVGAKQGPGPRPEPLLQRDPPPAAPPSAPPAPPGTRPAMGAASRPTRASDLEGHDDHHDGGGISPLDQMRARDEQSKSDAAVLVDARRQAALRALGSLGVLNEEPAKAPTSPSKPPPPAAGGSPASGDAPLLEIIPSQVLADDARTATRVTIHADRVELRSRSNEVVRRIATTDITDVTVNKRFTGTSVTIESRTGAPVVARGLRPDQADDIRGLLVDRRDSASAPDASAGAGAAPAKPSTPAEPGPRPAAGASAPAPAAKDVVADIRPSADDADHDADADDDDAADVNLDEAELLAKLGALRDAGVLTEAEHDEKVELVARLTRGDLAVTTAPGA